MKFFHSYYKLIGHIFCKMCLCYWLLRDFISPQKEDAVLFVAHPDDDTLFFHTFIKKHKPYVVLCTAGWSLRRLPCFFRAMKQYGVKYRVYDMGTRDTRVAILEKHIKSVLRRGNFKLCATHNAEGEYGHEMHKRVHQAVLKHAKVPVWMPVCAERINGFPLSEDVVEEKRFIFNTIYTTESWVLDQYSDWVVNEKLESAVI